MFVQIGRCQAPDPRCCPPTLLHAPFSSKAFTLVFHQCDEGRDDKAKSFSSKCGQLEAQTFSAPGWQQGQRVFSPPESKNRSHLMRAQCLETPVTFEKLLQWFWQV